MVPRHILMLISLPLLMLSGFAPSGQAMVIVGQEAPNFTRTDLDGTSHTLTAYRGKVVLLALVGYG